MEYLFTCANCSIVIMDSADGYSCPKCHKVMAKTKYDGDRLKQKIGEWINDD